MIVCPSCDTEDLEESEALAGLVRCDPEALEAARRAAELRRALGVPSS